MIQGGEGSVDIYNDLNLETGGVALALIADVTAVGCPTVCLTTGNDGT